MHSRLCILKNSERKNCIFWRKTYQRKGSLPYQTIYLLCDSLARLEGYVYDEVIGFEEIEEDKNDKL